MNNQENPLPVDTGKGFLILYQGKRLYSPSDPQGAVLNRIAKLHLQKGTLIFIPSPLLFYGIDALLALLPEQCHLLCVEADQRLMALSIKMAEQRYFAHPQITYIRTDNPVLAAGTLAELKPERFRRCTLLPLSGGYSLYSGTYKKIYQLLEQSIQKQWQNKITLIHMAPLWIRNIIDNLASLDDTFDLSCLKTNKPVFVLGAGESLEHSLALLKVIRPQIFILAVDTVLPILHHWDIIPDLILIMEAQFINLLDFLTFKERSSPIVFDLTSYNPVIQLFRGTKYSFISRFAPNRLITRLIEYGVVSTTFPGLGSVGVAAVHIATMITQEDIYLSGLDFSFIPGKMHARGAMSHQIILNTSHRLNPSPLLNAAYERPLIKTLDKNGRSCTTDLTLRSYALSLAGMAAHQSRIYDTGTVGLDLGCQHLALNNDFIRLIKTKKLLPLPDTKPLKADPRAISRFCSNELQLLTRLWFILQSLVQKEKIPEKNRKELNRLFIELDYLYLHFPEHQTLSNPQKNFLLRTLAPLKFYKNRFQQTLTRLKVEQ